MTGKGPRFIAPFLTAASPTHDDDLPRTGGDDPYGDLEQHVRQITRAKNLDQCENAIAQLPSNIVKHLLEIYDQVSASLLPAPIWQHPSTPAKTGRQREPDTVLRSLRITSAARLALAAEDSAKDQRLNDKVERVYRAASTYLNSGFPKSDLDELESLLLLSELEYSQGYTAAAEMRLQIIVSHLNNADGIRSLLLFGQSAALIRQRNALRTAILMLHWYFGQIAPLIQNLDGGTDSHLTEQLNENDELFTVSQLRLVFIHHQLQDHLLRQPYTDQKTWDSCERSLCSWYDDLREQYQSLNSMSDDASVNFFVFQQQYLTSRILLSKVHARRFHRLSSASRVGSPGFARAHGVRSSAASAKNDAVKIASSLRIYGQRHRFREAPLCFLNHVSVAADIVLGAILGVASEDDRNAYLHIASFLCSVLRYMAEVHAHAATLLEALQQRLNAVILQPPRVFTSFLPESDGYRPRPLSPDVPNQQGIDCHNSQLWHWTRQDFTAEFGHAAPPVENERPRSVLGVLKTAEELKLQGKRPTITRQTSTSSRGAMADDTVVVTSEHRVHSRVNGSKDGQ